MGQQDFLVEIGTEELPPKLLHTLAKSFAANMAKEIGNAALDFGELQFFATPRRLAVIVKNLADKQKARLIERRGPALQAAFDAEGNATKAALGFAQSCGVKVEELETQKNAKGAWLLFRQQQAGQKSTNLLPEITKKALAKLPITKPMRWNSHEFEFVRPVHWILMLYGNTPVAAKLFGLNATRNTHGHRFHHPAAIPIETPHDYETLLHSKGKVIANFDKRKEIIREQIMLIAAENKAQAIIDVDLLNEVTALVEWPVALLGSFEATFLDIPHEVLISSMKSHQKYFPVVDKQQQLLPNFITISNIVSKKPQQVLHGNERVLRARLADAGFFYQTDIKHTLESRLDGLESVIFQTKLGSLYDKAKRLALFAGEIAEQLDVNSRHAKRAGLLSKSDLLSEMVGEFPELQGIMGYYYALHDKESEAVAIAMKEQYQPRFSGDILPETDIGCCLALAERIDTLIGIFGINQQPTGEKDPFALRRAALGIIRILIEKKLALNLKELLQLALSHYERPLQNKNVLKEAFNFTMERLRYWYLEKGVNADVFAAVYAKQPLQPLDFDYRIKAVCDFQKLPEAKALAAANKRVSNILKQAIKTTSITNGYEKFDVTLLQQTPEHDLADLIQSNSAEVEKLYQQKQYTQIFTTLAKLQQPIDHFFDQVMVMTDDEKIRKNRLALLNKLRKLFLHVADISLLQS